MTDREGSKWQKVWQGSSIHKHGKSQCFTQHNGCSQQSKAHLKNIQTQILCLTLISHQQPEATTSCSESNMHMWTSWVAVLTADSQPDQEVGCTTINLDQQSASLLQHRWCEKGQPACLGTKQPLGLCPAHILSKFDGCSWPDTLAAGSASKRNIASLKTDLLSEICLPKSTLYPSIDKTVFEMVEKETCLQMPSTWYLIRALIGCNGPLQCLNLFETKWISHSTSG